MHPQLEVLLQIQDLKTQRRDLAEGDAHARVEAEEFNIDVDRALLALDAKIADLEGELEGEVRRRYDRIALARARVVVPAIDATCYGCFVSVPTARWPHMAENEAVHHCDNCGRFLYAVG